MLLTVPDRVDFISQFITVVVIFILVLGITYLTTKWLAGYQKEKSAGSNVEVLETARITANKYIQIVRCADKYLAIAVCKDTVTVLAELEPEQIRISEGRQNIKPDFKEMLKKAGTVNILEKEHKKKE